MSWSIPETQPDMSNEAEEPKKDNAAPTKLDLPIGDIIFIRQFSLDKALDFHNHIASSGLEGIKDHQVVNTAKKFYKFITEGK